MVHEEQAIHKIWKLLIYLKFIENVSLNGTRIINDFDYYKTKILLYSLRHYHKIFAVWVYKDALSNNTLNSQKIRDFSINFFKKRKLKSENIRVRQILKLFWSVRKNIQIQFIWIK